MKDTALTLVTDQLPFPPRNGITLPMFNYLERLRPTHRLSVCLLHAQGEAPDGDALQANAERYGPIRCIPLRRHGLLRRAFDELRGAEMLQHGWRAGGVALEPHERFEAVLVSPMSAVAKWRAVTRANPSLQPRAMVAAVNDCTAAEYHYRIRTAPAEGGARIKAWLDRARSPQIGRIEAALLSDCLRVLVQTEADRQAMRELVGADVACRCLLAPNGIRSDLFGLQPTYAENVAFVAELSGEYGPLTQWLCTQVWPLVRAQRPQATLTIVGRGAPGKLRALMAQTPGVEHHEYAADLAAVYADMGLVWSPVFKGFGLINKTLEAMASGLPVVGGTAAFNGIHGFVEGTHGVGLAGPDARAYAKQTIRLLQSPAARREMGLAARRLITGQFSWDRTVSTLQSAFEQAPVVQAAREASSPLALPGSH